MNKERTHYKVNIFGEQYVVVSNDPADLVEDAASLVDFFMKEIATKTAGIVGIDTKKIVVLAALQIASQLVSLKNEKEQFVIKRASLIAKIDHVLNTCVNQ